MKSVLNFRFVMFLVGSSLLTANVIAQPQFGNSVDNTCMAFNGTTPYDTAGCALCHTNSYSQRMEPAWSYWFNNNLTQFCGSAPSNQAPNSTIVSPASNQTISVGGSIFFQGSGSDPDNDFPLSFRWDFAGAATNSFQQTPGSVTFATAGTYAVQFIVTDNLGATDPTPAQRIITVIDANPNLCIDNDNDGYSTQGGACGLVDCNDNDPTINPGASEICGDNLDNNCNGLTDSADPTAPNCGLSCTDNDGDDFSPQGGICGPIDCNDSNPLINPGVNENCGDGIDNDCDGATDTADSECIAGGDCVGGLVPQQVIITQAAWDAASRSVILEGRYHKLGEYVLVTSVANNILLGVTMVNNQGGWALTMRNPYFVPCQIKVSIAGSSAQAIVVNAPASCDGGQAPTVDNGNDDDRDDDNDSDEQHDEDETSESDREQDDDTGNSDFSNDEDHEDENISNTSRDEDNDDADSNRRSDSESDDEQRSRDEGRDASVSIIVGNNETDRRRNSGDDDDDDERRSNGDRDDDDDERRNFARGVSIDLNDKPTVSAKSEETSGSMSLWFILMSFSSLLFVRVRGLQPGRD